MQRACFNEFHVFKSSALVNKLVPRSYNFETQWRSKNVELYDICRHVYGPC